MVNKIGGFLPGKGKGSSLSPVGYGLLGGANGDVMAPPEVASDEVTVLLGMRGPSRSSLGNLNLSIQICNS